jgi:hypothetical protein
MSETVPSPSAKVDAESAIAARPVRLSELSHGGG